MDVVAPVRALSFMNMNSRLKVRNGDIRVNVWRYLRRLWLLTALTQSASSAPTMPA
jgi:hypothetical protein